MSIESKIEMLEQSRASIASTKGYARLQKLFDDGSFVEIDAFAKSGKVYAEAVAGCGTIDGEPVYAFAQNSEFDGGAMSKAQAAKIKKVYDLAAKTGAPVVAVYDSIGAKLNEGYDMLAAYGDILKNTNNLSGVVPQVSVILGTCLGTMALIASTADIVIMSEKSQFALETNGNGGDLKSAVEEGLCHLTAKDDDEAIKKARHIIGMLPSNNLALAPFVEYDAVESADAELQTAISSITNGKDASKEVIKSIVDVDSFVEFQPDFGKEFTVGLATIGGNTVGIVASKGTVADANSCSKTARFIRFCDAFAIPVVNFVDSQGFESLISATKVATAYAEATTAKITIITGSAYGAFYVAMAGTGASADITLAWPSAAISALNPTTAVAFMYTDKLKGSKNPIEDRKKLVAEYKDKECCPFIAAANGYVEDVINPSETRDKLFSILDMLSGKRVSKLPKKHGNINI